MEKVFIVLGIVFVVVVIIFMIQQIIYSIQESCDKSAIEKTRNSTNPNIYLEVAMLRNKLTSAELQLQTYRTEYAKRMQEKLNKKEKYCNEEPIQGIHCKDCKNNVSSIACKANVKCKLFEQK